MHDKDVPLDMDLPVGRNSEEGCVHSIVRRTGASFHDVREFKRQWCLLNSDVLIELQKEINLEPFRNFFS